MILTVLLMFSGPGVIAVFCTAKAYCGAKEVSKIPKECCSAACYYIIVLVLILFVQKIREYTVKVNLSFQQLLIVILFVGNFE